MKDYKKIEVSHRLSRFQVKLPHWDGEGSTRSPFASWPEPLDWYEAYNASKHNRHTAFRRATFGHVVDTVCGVLAILSAQFANQDFALIDNLVSSSPPDGFEYAIGNYFVVRYPDDWPEAERYAFGGGDFRAADAAGAELFQNFPY